MARPAALAPRLDRRSIDLTIESRTYPPLPALTSPTTHFFPTRAHPQVVDDEALEELLKEVGRALVEASFPGQDQRHSRP